jgi:hypothetical protein
MPIFKTKSGIPICDGFTRLVIGGRGAYLEFEKEHFIRENLYMPDDQRWRIKHRKCYYLEYRTIKDFVKIYYQKRKVNYADYLPGKFYISPDDLII